MTTRLIGLSAIGITLVAPIPSTAADAPVVLTIEGTPAPLRLTASDIAAMPHNTVVVTIQGTTLTCAGPWLTDVLARAGVPRDEAVRGIALSSIVAATGADGYRVAFTVGELDHKLGNAPVIVADQCDGHALSSANGPLRLVASADKRGARSVKQLVRLTLIQMPVAAAP